MNNKILITGGTHGIGLELVKLFTSQRDKVLIVSRNREEVDKVCKTYGCEGLALDISNEGSEMNLSAWLFGRLGHNQLDVLINNAGVITWKPFKEQSANEIVSQLRTNLEGTVRVTKKLLGKVSSKIINISSGAGTKGHADLVPYCASKFGVVGFTEALSKEIQSPEVYCISPMMVKTRMTNHRGLEPTVVANLIRDVVYCVKELEHGSNYDMQKKHQGGVE